jgi:protein gp37
MGEKTGISWTDATWTPLKGTIGRWHCQKSSPGCANCYAEAMNIRFKGPPYIAGADTIRLSEKALNDPIRWARKAKPPRLIFVCSMTDLFGPWVPFDMIDSVIDVIGQCPDTWFQILTKWPARAVEYAQSRELGALHNVAFGATIENDAARQERQSALLTFPAVIRFVSYEPAIGPVNWSALFRDSTEPIAGRAGIQWLLAGGESGPKARPPHPAWFRNAAEWARVRNVHYLLKQWGQWAPIGPMTARQVAVAIDGSIMPDDRNKAAIWKTEVEQATRRRAELTTMYSVGKKAAGRLLDNGAFDTSPGQVFDQWPPELRQNPQIADGMRDRIPCDRCQELVQCAGFLNLSEDGSSVCDTCKRAEEEADGV